MDNNGVYIEIDYAEIEKKLKKLENIPKASKKALKNTLNMVVKPKSKKNMKDFSMEELQKEYTIKKSKVKSRVEIKKATISRLSASVETRDRPMGLTYFKTRTHKKPVKKGSAPAKAQVKKSGSLKQIPKAFIATMPNGHKGVFWRISKKRTKLKQGFGPGASQMLANEKVKTNIANEMSRRFNEEFDKEIEKIINDTMN